MHVVLVHPEIPANTGNIARTCAATRTPLHLVEPLGFRLTDRQMKRAGLDYWQAVELYRYPSWEAFLSQHPHRRLWCFEVQGSHCYTEIAYQADDYLVFGSETRGLGERILAAHPSVHIPIDGPVRSLNLANAVAIALFEARRQLARHH
ncbi:MAG: tRNA (cytidine(34)-2'-O)-methyltransferase [Thermostichales cyanobacterium BF4_bins_65]